MDDWTALAWTVGQLRLDLDIEDAIDLCLTNQAKEVDGRADAAMDRLLSLAAAS